VKTDSKTWGSQLEIQALVNALKVPIEIYSADAPTVKMGEEFGQVDEQPLLLRYITPEGPFRLLSNGI